jgi:hypothetical protein
VNVLTIKMQCRTVSVTRWLRLLYRLPSLRTPHWENNWNAKYVPIVFPLSGPSSEPIDTADVNDTRHDVSK